MKLRNIFMILASAALLTACDDVFTPAAENMKDINEMENDPIMAKGFVLTAYRNLPNYEVGTGTDVATDDAVTNEKGANWSKYATGSWTVQSWDPTGRWNNDLSSMQYLYIFLNSNISNIGFLKNANENKLMQRRLTGEAYGLLATHAYYLLRAHAGFDNEGKLLGTQLFDGFVGTDADFNQPRKTFQEHVDFILANIEKADKLLPMVYEPVTSDDKVPAKYDDILNVPEVTSVKDGKMGIYNKVMGENARQLINGLILRAIKARTLLLAASPAFQDPAQNNVTWAQAADAAAEVVDYVGGPSGLPKTGLTYYDNDDEMKNLKNGSNPPEIIWRSTRNAEEIDDEKNNFPPSLYGNGRTNPTQNLVDAFPDAKGYPITDPRSEYDESNPYANRDPRLANYIIYNGAKAGVDNKEIKTGSSSGDDGIGRRDASTRTGYYMKKMLRMTANCNPSSTSKVTKYSCKARFTEFFLDYAEAANEAWGPKNPGTHAYSAYDVIKAIRHRAGLTDDTYLDECAGDQAKMRELIRNERRLELCFEGFRFWDLRRWNQLDKLTSVQGIDWNNDTFTILPNVEERHFDSYMNYGYIPYSEALKYSNLHQNKGWK